MAIPVQRTASGRRYCRQCGSLAGITRNLCSGCQDAEVRRHLEAGRNAPKPTPEDVQDAYAASLVTAPPVATGNTYAVAALAGASPEERRTATLSQAWQFGATLAVVPTDTHAAEVFFAYSRRAFYLHVRSLLRTFDPRLRLPTRRRDGDSARERKNVKGATVQNRSLAKALRLTRIFLQMEMVPLALKIDCSQSQIWHLETGNNVVLHKWVERYAEAFEISTESLYRFAAALVTSNGGELAPKALLRTFATVVLGSEAASSAAVSVVPLKEVTGAATHVPRKTASAKRTHPGTGYPMNKAIGQALRYCRLRRRIDVPEFCATSGLSSSHVYNMECDRKTVGNHIVAKYAETLGVTVAAIWMLADEILAEEDPTAIDDRWLESAFRKACGARNG